MERMRHREVRGNFWISSSQQNIIFVPQSEFLLAAGKLNNHFLEISLLVVQQALKAVLVGVVAPTLQIFSDKYQPCRCGRRPFGGSTGLDNSILGSDATDRHNLVNGVFVQCAVVIEPTARKVFSQRG